MAQHQKIMAKDEEKPVKNLTPDEKEKVEQLESDLKKITPLDVLARSAGGKILVEGLLVDIVSNVDSLISNYRTWTLQEFIANAASTKEKLDLVRAIKNSKDTKEFLEQELKETLAQ